MTVLLVTLGQDALLEVLATPMTPQQAPNRCYCNVLQTEENKRDNKIKFDLKVT